MTNKTDRLTDKQLVEKIMSGDTDVFAAIIKNTEALVAQIVFKMISNVEDRKDIAQDIYLKAYKNLPRFRFGSKLSTWIAQIAYNTCLDYIRRKKLILVENLCEEEKTGNIKFNGIQNIFNNPGPEPAIFRKDLSQLLKTEIEKLSPVFKTLISLFHNEEMSYDDIAQITGLPEGTVKNYLFRARKALKDSLLENYKKEEL